jgi:hypothetical protein
MSILFTADIQAEWSNLDRCNGAWNEILTICKKEKLKYIVLLGDLKQAMNPVDIRVVKWWQYAIRKARKHKLIVLILLGNHDRVGAYSNADNWLSILKHAGGITFDRPGIYQAGEYTLAMLPYMGVSETRVEAKKLAKNIKGKNNILCFHQDITGARYNLQGSKSDAYLSSVDLKSSSYKFCIGGHIHLPQVISGEGHTKNVFYVGSPFCHDWGEVNQRKRYLIVDKGKIRNIYSNSYGYYDPSVSGFRESAPASWKYTKVRISVPCDASEDYGRRLEKARRRAEKKYKGAEIYVVPKFSESSGPRLEGLTSTDSDERKIKEYVRGSKGTDVGSELAVDYMLEKLSHFSGGLRTTSRVKFIRAIGQNFLSFKKVDLDLTRKGITLIQGVNEDRNGKSNGSGKTSLVQLLPVGFFGRTFKDQKANSWANRWRRRESAFAEVVTKTNDKVIKIVRGRRPTLLRMYVDGKDVSSGMKTTDKYDGSTQSQIEKVTGFTWQTLANAVYIDRQVADSFLSGTKKQRTDVLSRFQNLERFERALRLVREDIKQADIRHNVYREKVASKRSAIEHTEKSIKDIKKISDTQLKSVHNQYMYADKKLSKFKLKTMKARNKLRFKIKLFARKYQKALQVQNKLQNKVSMLQYTYNDLKRILDNTSDVLLKKDCPTCYQPVSEKWVERYRKDIKHDRVKVKRVLGKYLSSNAKHTKFIELLNHKDNVYQKEISKIDNKENSLQVSKTSLQRQYDKLSREQHKDSSVLSEAKKRLKRLKYKKERLKFKVKKLDKKRKIYEYATTAFSRDGIPAFLNRQLCPVLNKAAAYYAELFSDSELQVQFLVELGEFIPKVINAKGGKEIDDQSTGERALAGLIASFALREVAPSCNLLILDEPGEGLDEATARQFAKSLRRLVKRFKAIYVCSHNPAILSELGNERIITVRKRHKISRMEE